MLKLLLSKSFNSSLLIDNPSYEEDDISLICHIIGNCIQQNSDWPVNSKMKARKAILKLISLYSDNRFLMENLFAIIDPIEQASLFFILFFYLNFSIFMLIFYFILFIFNFLEIIHGMCFETCRHYQ